MKVFTYLYEFLQWIFWLLTWPLWKLYCWEEEHAQRQQKIPREPTWMFMEEDT